MEVKIIVQELREKGRCCILEGNGKIVELIVPDHYEAEKDQDALFLLVDIFQIRGIAGQFSEIALDIVEFATKPTVYTSTASPLLEKGPIEDGKVKFSILKPGFWNKIVFNFGRPLLFKQTNDSAFLGEVKDKFPLFGSGVKKLFLSPEGEVKIGGE